VDHVDHLVETLEQIAHFATGLAGVSARNALVVTGYWPVTIPDDERPHLTDTWLSAGAAMPGHDLPADDGRAAALATGRIGLFPSLTLVAAAAAAETVDRAA
jgi:hypothetical protein